MKEQFFITEKAEVPTLVLRNGWSREVAEYMRSHEVIGLRLSGYMGWRSTNLDFLHQVPFIEYLDILTTKLADVSGLYALKQLTYLSLEGTTPAIKLSQFPRLKTLALGRTSSKLHRVLPQAKSLRKLALTGPDANTLATLRHLSLLQDLGISRAKTVDLGFVANTRALRKLSLVACNLLETLNGLEKAKDIVVLMIEQAKKLHQIDSLGRLRQLRTLVLNDCPKIESIKSVAGLPDLETIGLMQRTNIADGDLSPLTTLAKLHNATFLDRLHYSHRNEEFPKGQRTFY